MQESFNFQNPSSATPLAGHYLTRPHIKMPWPHPGLATLWPSHTLAWPHPGPATPWPGHTPARPHSGSAKAWPGHTLPRPVAALRGCRATLLQLLFVGACHPLGRGGCYLLNHPVHLEAEALDLLVPARQRLLGCKATDIIHSLSSAAPPGL